jgi:hypothetical protein
MSLKRNDLNIPPPKGAASQSLPVSVVVEVTVLVPVTVPVPVTVVVTVPDTVEVPVPLSVEVAVPLPAGKGALREATTKTASTQGVKRVRADGRTGTGHPPVLKTGTRDPELGTPAEAPGKK